MKSECQASRDKPRRPLIIGGFIITAILSAALGGVGNRVLEYIWPDNTEKWTTIDNDINKLYLAVKDHDHKAMNGFNFDGKSGRLVWMEAIQAAQKLHPNIWKKYESDIRTVHQLKTPSQWYQAYNTHLVIGKEAHPESFQISLLKHGSSIFASSTGFQFLKKNEVLSEIMRVRLNKQGINSNQSMEEIKGFILVKDLPVNGLSVGYPTIDLKEKSVKSRLLSGGASSRALAEIDGYAVPVFGNENWIRSDSNRRNGFIWPNTINK